MSIHRNSRIAKVLRMMADGQPRSVRDIAEEMELTRAQAENVIRNSRKFLSVSPVRYAISEKGVDHLRILDAPKPKKSKATGRKRGRPRKVIAPVVVQSPVVPVAEPVDSLSPYDSETVVRMGMQSRTALDMAWGRAA